MHVSPLKEQAIPLPPRTNRSSMISLRAQLQDVNGIDAAVYHVDEGAQFVYGIFAQLNDPAPELYANSHYSFSNPVALLARQL